MCVCESPTFNSTTDNENVIPGMTFSLSGVELKVGDLTIKVRTTLRSIVWDAPARCSVQNMTQFNGPYGYSNCLSKVKSVPSKKGKVLLNPL